jgi:3-dehydroquinate dehydratase
MAKRAGTRKAQKKGSKKTRKLSPALKQWNEKVMKVFREKRKSNPNYKLMDAMREAKKLK